MGMAIVGGIAGLTYVKLLRNDPTTTVGAGFADGTNTYNFAFTAVIELT